ncbi:MAG: RNA polymerase sigma-70 factor [Balneolales bacterium]
MNILNKNNRHASEPYLILEICNGNEKAYEELYFEYYYQLCRFAESITKCSELARDIVQEVFLNIWVKRKSWEVKHSLKAYLYQAVRNQALNMVEQQGARHGLSVRLKEEFDMQSKATAEEGDDPASKLPGLINQIWELVEEMPDQRKMVFVLHRKHGLSYLEISEVMGIARKTVENHMGKVFQELREKLDTRVYL